MDLTHINRVLARIPRNPDLDMPSMIAEIHASEPEIPIQIIGETVRVYIIGRKNFSKIRREIKNEKIVGAIWETIETVRKTKLQGSRRANGPGKGERGRAAEPVALTPPLLKTGSKRIAAEIELFTQNPIAPRQSIAYVWEALVRFAHGNPPRDQREKDIFSYIRKRRLGEKITEKLTARRENVEDTRKRVGNMLSRAEQRLSELERLRREEHGRPTLTSKRARSLEEFNGPLILGKEWKPPIKRGRKGYGRKR